jgi:uncharacterized lipoprotein YddW (UPF0748 family)
MSNPPMTKAFALLPATLLLAGAACAFAAQPPGRIGVYARLYDDAASPEKLRQTMKRIKSVGIDFILPSGKGTAGSISWDSQVAPKALIRDRTYMERIVQAAHAEGLKVCPVVCVVTEGGESEPNALLREHPSWAFFAAGARRGFIDVGNPDARAYEVSLIAELVGKYDVDGLSLDYCRWPSRIGYTDTGRAELLKQHHVDLARITKAGAETLDTEGGKQATRTNRPSPRDNPIWPEWRKWKTEQINILAREIRAGVNKTKPGLPISSYVWGYNTYVSKSEVCQDWMTWIKDGALDWINPSGYRYTDDAFLEAARLNREHVPTHFPFYITIGVKTSHGSLKDATAIRSQMAMARQCGADGLVFFTWEALAPFADELAGDLKSFGRKQD